MTPFSVALMVYGNTSTKRDVLSEEKYKDLATAFPAAGFTVMPVLYNDELRDSVYKNLMGVDAVLVWVNPIEQDKDRKILDSMLSELAGTGCLVSAHPDTILKMGTKEILFQTKDMGWRSETKLYPNYENFVARFPESIKQSLVKILKQCRGNGGNGVFKIVSDASGKELTVIPAKESHNKLSYSWQDFFKAFSSYFSDGGLLIEQEWNPNQANGMVRCYLCGNKVAGFGYQEINMLYEQPSPAGNIQLTPSRRYY